MIPVPPDYKDREDWNKAMMVYRSTLIMLLGVVDDLLGLPRTVPPKNERKKSGDG